MGKVGTHFILPKSPIKAKRRLKWSPEKRGPTTAPSSQKNEEEED